MPFKYFFGMILLLANSQLFYSQYTDIINSNRPGESFGAFSAGKTVLQTEGGVSYIYEKNSKTETKTNGIFTDLDIRYGFWREELEFIADLQYQTDRLKTDSTMSINRNAFKTSQFGLKYLIYDPLKNYTKKADIYSWKNSQKFQWRELLPAIAMYASANINLSKNNPYLFENEENISAKGMIILQNHFPKNWVSVINFWVDKIGTDYMTYGGILTATKSFSQRWSGFGEVQSYKNDYLNDFILRIGSAYLLHENLQFDASIGKNFQKDRDLIYGGIGVSWRMDSYYEDQVIYKKPKKEKRKKTKKKKK